MSIIIEKIKRSFALILVLTAEERATGEHYAKQIKEATDQLKTSNPLAYTTRVNVPGYREYLASLEETTSDLHNKP